MATLHLVNSAYALEQCLARSRADDRVVLMHDACYATVERDHVFTLLPHAQMRGIPAPVNPIDYNGLVSLTEEHAPVVTWR